MSLCMKCGFQGRGKSCAACEFRDSDDYVYCSPQEEWVGHPMTICGYHQVPWPCVDERLRRADLGGASE